MDMSEWLAREIAAVEARLQGHGPMCQLDRKGASPPSLKESEGRYAVLRRAARLLARGDGLDALEDEYQRAQAFTQGGSAVASDPVWTAYFRGVREAVEQLRALARQGGV
jgi:hypothetical protein